MNQVYKGCAKRTQQNLLNHIGLNNLSVNSDLSSMPFFRVFCNDLFFTCKASFWNDMTEYSSQYDQIRAEVSD